MSMLRTRWAAVGAAVAITLGAGGIGVANAIIAVPPPSGYSAIKPCRLLDTRANKGVGGRTTPLGPGEVMTIDLANTADECPDQPAGISAVGLNVTALFATGNTDLRFWAEGDPPNAANLNPAPGQPPTPNAVTTEVTAAGTFQVRNAAADVDLIIDLVGVYQRLDDRYYTKGQIDARVPRIQHASVGSAAFTPVNGDHTYIKTLGQGGAYENGGTGVDHLVAPVQLPDGATITSVQFSFYDYSIVEDIDVRLSCEYLGSGVFDVIGSVSSSGVATGWQRKSVTGLSKRVDNADCAYVVTASANWTALGALSKDLLQVKGASIEYTLPG